MAERRNLGGATGHIKAITLFPFPHQRKVCTEGLLGRHALCMLGRTLVDNLHLCYTANEQRKHMACMHTLGVDVYNLHPEKYFGRTALYYTPSTDQF